jgi:uncharacterized protein (UPF0264 family)
VARLLVSVRSVEEATAALAGGASILDVKEPTRGSLGRSDPVVWKSIRSHIPADLPVSVALGELTEWQDTAPVPLAGDDLDQISWVKLGLARAGVDWEIAWRRLIDSFDRTLSSPPAWVAVIYADWQNSSAPPPDEVIRGALNEPRCQGVLIDTWTKNRREHPFPLDAASLQRVRESGRFLAMAGSLNEAAICRLGSLRPDVVAVRGAACHLGNRLGPIDPESVSRLAKAVSALPVSQALQSLRPSEFAGSSGGVVSRLDEGRSKATP